MKFSKIKIVSLIIITALFLSFSVFAQNEDKEKFKTVYDEEKDITTVLLRGIELPKNKESFSIGGSFEFKGKTLAEMPCCAVLFFTSVSKNKFKYKENHNLKIWADKEVYDFGKINWQESYYAYAFVLSGIAYPEEIFVGMESEKFLRIIKAKKVKAQLGNFKFDFTDEQLKSLRELVENVKNSIKSPI